MAKYTKEKLEELKKRRVFYKSPMEDAEDERINELTTTEQKLAVIGLIEVVLSAAQIWTKGCINQKNFTQWGRTKITNCFKDLRDATLRGSWSKADYEYATWCLWFIELLKYENGNVILYENEKLYDLWLDLLALVEEGMVEDFINSEIRFNKAILHKTVEIV